MNLIDLRDQMPNFQSYKNWRRPSFATIEGIVIHHTGSGTVNGEGPPNLFPKEMADAHVNGEGRAHVSYHYAVGRDGTVFYLLDEEISGYHLFLDIPSRKNNPAEWNRWNTQFRGGQYFNYFTVGVVLLGWFDSSRRVGNGIIADGNNTPSPAQVAAAVELVRDIQKRRNIPIAKIEGHGEILARTRFGHTTCPGTQFSMSAFREAVAAGGPVRPAPVDGATPVIPPGPITVPDPPPALRLNFRNRPLVGLHARNDTTFTPADWAIIRAAKVESLKMMSQTADSAYEEARRIDPNMEFIVRLYSGRTGKGKELPPEQFGNLFRDTINRLHQKFGVLKFEIHNEPNHMTGHEGWGQERADALSFQEWYKRVFAILRANHPWALLGYPGLAVPHKDLEWLDWNREAIEMSDWLGVHPYWQTPTSALTTFRSDVWGQRYLHYHEKYPHKLLEITEFGNSNGQGNPPIPFSREQQRDQYVEWFGAIMDKPWIGSAHSFLATSPDPTWRNQGFTWGDDSGPFPVAGAIGNLPRPQRAPDWYYAFAANVPVRAAPGVELSFPVTLGNGGRLPWLKRGVARSAISAKWVQPVAGGTEKVIEEGGRWLELPHDMVSGDIVSFRLKMVTPPQAGTYRLRLAVFHHGHQRWLHDLEEVTIPDYFPIEIVAVQPQPAPTPPAPAPTPPTPAPVPTPSPAPTPPAGQFGVAYSVTLPQKLTVGEQLTLPVTLTNTGTRVWVARGANPVVLVPQWLTQQGRPVNATLRSPLPIDVLPQERLTVNVSLLAPAESGSYFFRLDMAEEGKGFFSQQGVAPLRRQVKIDAVSGIKEWDAEWIEARVPATLAPGAAGRIDLRLRNRGSETWEASTIRLAYHWGDNNPVRVGLPTTVATGEEVAFGVPILAPATVGDKTLSLDLWREGSGWLGIAAPPQRVMVGMVGERGLDDGVTPDEGLSGDVPPVPVVRYPANASRDSAMPVRPVTENGEMPAGEIAIAHNGSGLSDALPADDDVAPADSQAAMLAPEPPHEHAAVMVSENTADVRLLFDGDPMTAWRTSGKQQGGEWIQLDFGSVRSVAAIRVDNLPEEHPRGFRMERSVDGTSWALLAAAPENHERVVVTPDAPVALRFLKLTQTNRSPFHHWSVVEVSLESEKTPEP